MIAVEYNLTKTGKRKGMFSVPDVAEFVRREYAYITSDRSARPCI
jgi:hypothetical protein